MSLQQAFYHRIMEIRVRPTASREEEQLSLEIYNTVWPRAAATMAEVDSYKESALAYADHLAWLDGEPVGSGFVAIQPQRPDVGHTGVTVLPTARNRGLGTALYREVSRWCAAQDLETIEAPVEEDDDASLEYASRRGFVEVERNGRMILDLTELEPPPLDPPAGIEILTWAERPELAQGIYGVAAEAYADVPGAENEEMEPFEDWLAHDMRGSADRPEATFVAVAGDEVVGYSKFHLTAAQPGVAHHDMTGVKRAWRGRGIAGALKRAQIAWAKQGGYERLETANEMRNTPIRRLNERLGYRAAPGRVLMRGPLAEL
jgi:GNAT superfamily N-acetyltransferase